MRYPDRRGPAMPVLSSPDATLFYELRGSGAPVVLLHPFPVHHEFWLPMMVAAELERDYRLLLPDLRGHGQSEAGEGPATMAQHCADLLRLCDEAGMGRAVFAGCSIGGYILFEFWRRHRERVAGLVLCNTKATADPPEAQANRMRIADEVLAQGTRGFLDTMVPRLLAETTQRTRPDVVAAARGMMDQMSAAGLAAVQRGMAARADSIATLPAINVPTLLVTGDEDILTGVADAQLMLRGIGDSELTVLSRAGHYAPFEQPEAFGSELRRFLRRAAPLV